MKTMNKIIFGPVSIDPTANGAAIDINQLWAISAHVVAANGTSPSSAIKLQVSNDIPPNGDLGTPAFVPTNWTDLSGATATITVNGALLIPKTEVCYRWLRVVNTYTSGTGTVTVTLFGFSA